MVSDSARITTASHPTLLVFSFLIGTSHHRRGHHVRHHRGLRLTDYHTAITTAPALDSSPFITGTSSNSTRSRSHSQSHSPSHSHSHSHSPSHTHPHQHHNQQVCVCLAQLYFVRSIGSCGFNWWSNSVAINVCTVSYHGVMGQWKLTALNPRIKSVCVGFRRITFVSQNFVWVCCMGMVWMFEMAMAYQQSK